MVYTQHIETLPYRRRCGTKTGQRRRVGSHSTADDDIVVTPTTLAPPRPVRILFDASLKKVDTV
ncbi:hypothetical protein MPRF_15130 [Mycolicibacterium parafortuitum]|uniref:Uncharacterized protein n=1 Tax=Mycolicibacterium parafortuitum TaxID=39692 RepID=A0A7I7U018_MYCPF|nr:hypothetical protein MPRF_15130 [Mycolicibacterium parafortuitum]